MDKWDRKTGFCCRTCASYAPKDEEMGRCRRHAPTMQGYPVVYAEVDWCGEHKVGSNPSKAAYVAPVKAPEHPILYNGLFDYAMAKKDDMLRAWHSSGANLNVVTNSKGVRTTPFSGIEGIGGEIKEGITGDFRDEPINMSGRPAPFQYKTTEYLIMPRDEIIQDVSFKEKFKLAIQNQTPHKISTAYVARPGSPNIMPFIEVRILDVDIEPKSRKSARFPGIETFLGNETVGASGRCEVDYVDDSQKDPSL